MVIQTIMEQSLLIWCTQFFRRLRGFSCYVNVNRLPFSNLFSGLGGIDCDTMIILCISLCVILFYILLCKKMLTDSIEHHCGNHTVAQ